MRNLYRLFGVALLAVCITACAALGQPTPETLNQKVAVGIGFVTETRATASALLAAGKIGPDDAENVQRQADVARDGLAVARKMAGTNLSDATSRAEAINVGLRALLATLQAKQGGSK